MAHVYAPLSRCSQELPLHYVWAEGPGERTHIDAAVDALMGTLKGRGRQWNPFSEKLTRAEFRKRLQAAERGELEPVEEVAHLASGSDGWLYEIRWSGISVRYAVGGDAASYYDAEVRAIHGEPPRLPMHLIGVHVHEKVWVDGDDAQTEQIQNGEIRLAVQRFWGLASQNWGLL